MGNHHGIYVDFDDDRAKDFCGFLHLQSPETNKFNAGTPWYLKETTIDGTVFRMAMFLFAFHRYYDNATDWSEPLHDPESSHWCLMMYSEPDAEVARQIRDNSWR